MPVPSFPSRPFMQKRASSLADWSPCLSVGRELTYHCNAMHCRSGLIATPMLGLLYPAPVFEFAQKLRGKECAYALWAGL